MSSMRYAHVYGLQDHARLESWFEHFQLNGCLTRPQTFHLPIYIYIYIYVYVYTYMMNKGTSLGVTGPLTHDPVSFESLRSPEPEALRVSELNC